MNACTICNLSKKAVDIDGIVFEYVKLKIKTRIFTMSDHIYKKIEIVGSSSKSIEDAIENAVTRAGQSVKNLRWFEVAETRGHIEDGKVKHYQVTLKIGFTLEEENV